MFMRLTSPNKNKIDQYYPFKDWFQWFRSQFASKLSIFTATIVKTSRTYIPAYTVTTFDWLLIILNSYSN